MIIWFELSAYAGPAQQLLESKAKTLSGGVDIVFVRHQFACQTLKNPKILFSLHRAVRTFKMMWHNPFGHQSTQSSFLIPMTIHELKSKSERPRYYENRDNTLIDAPLTSESHNF